MKPNSETEAMRALSDLYRTEAERIDSTRMQDAAAVTIESAHLSEPAAVPLDQWITAVRAHQPKASGVSEETAWKILTVTFALTGLAGFLAVLLTDKAPTTAGSPATSLEMPSCFDLVPLDSPRQKEPSSPSLDGPIASPPSPAAATRSKEIRQKNTRGKTKVQEKTDANTKGKTGRNTDGLDFFKDCGMDPMCGYDKKN
jgi:hypothetical protein